MQNLYTALPDHLDEERRRNFNRLLKRLRTALFLWLLAFIATVIWFTYAH